MFVQHCGFYVLKLSMVWVVPTFFPRHATPGTSDQSYYCSLSNSASSFHRI